MLHDVYSCDFPDWFGALRSLVYLFRIVIGLNFLLTARSVIESRQGQLSVFHTCYAIYPSSYSVDAMVFFFFGAPAQVLQVLHLLVT